MIDIILNKMYNIDINNRKKAFQNSMKQERTGGIMTEKIISMPIGFNPSKWSRKTNCYMYAINYQKDNKPRDVGELSGNLIKDYYTIDEIKERLFKDMKMLNIEIKKATYEDECLENGWKIALFYREEDGDFHFLREDYHNRWSHKTKGRKPSNKDYSNATIIDPRWANLMEYEFVEFYKLKCH